MTWGFISPWAIDPFNRERPRPFNARSEPLKKKNYLVEVGNIKDA